MKPETRRVFTFIVLGLLFAAAVGFGVWRIGSPESASVTDNAMAQDGSAIESANTQETTSKSKSSTKPKSSERTSSSHSHPSRTQGQQQQRVMANAEDPYLAPNAVVDGTGASSQPTQYYRPENISERSTTAQQAPTRSQWQERQQPESADSYATSEPGAGNSESGSSLAPTTQTTGTPGSSTPATPEPGTQEPTTEAGEPTLSPGSQPATEVPSPSEALRPAESGIETTLPEAATSLDPTNASATAPQPAEETPDNSTNDEPTELGGLIASLPRPGTSF